jgi:hypothetical protein
MGLSQRRREDSSQALEGEAGKEKGKLQEEEADGCTHALRGRGR